MQQTKELQHVFNICKHKHIKMRTTFSDTKSCCEAWCHQWRTAIDLAKKILTSSSRSWGKSLLVLLHFPDHFFFISSVHLLSCSDSAPEALVSEQPLGGSAKVSVLMLTPLPLSVYAFSASQRCLCCYMQNQDCGNTPAERNYYLSAESLLRHAFVRPMQKAARGKQQAARSGNFSNYCQKSCHSLRQSGPQWTLVAHQATSAAFITPECQLGGVVLSYHSVFC